MLFTPNCWSVLGSQQYCFKLINAHCYARLKYIYFSPYHWRIIFVKYISREGLMKVSLSETCCKSNTLMLKQKLEKCGSVNTTASNVPLQYICTTYNTTHDTDLPRHIQHWPSLLSWTLAHREGRLFFDTCSLITGSSQFDLGGFKSWCEIGDLDCFLILQL